MPVLQTPPYQPSFLFKFRHFSTIYPSLMRKVEDVQFNRQRIITPDNDFFDVDWAKVNSKKLVIALHGLEGSSESTYIKGLTKVLNQDGWDVAAMNFRGCSGDPNIQRRTYHSGETEDLNFLMESILQQSNYEEINLVGFSLGGNVALKYSGEKSSQLDTRIKKVIGISVPIDLMGCSIEISKWHNYIYLNRFLASLKYKFKLKQSQYPDLDANAIFKSKTFTDFDEAFTAPVHGFLNAKEYWEKSASINFLPKINIPTLLISAQDDSFLSETCYPYDLAEELPHLHLLAPQFGGHVGFPQTHPKGVYWTEERILDFLKK